MFRFPESVKLDINEDRIYAVVWDFLMRLQEELPRALMYYGVRDEEGREKNTATLGIFLPFHHFETKMEKNIEIANGIGLGCREHILAEINRQAGKKHPSSAVWESCFCHAEPAHGESEAP